VTGKKRWWFLAVILVVLYLSGCARTISEVSLAQEFSLSPGQSARVRGENLTIKFIKVASDSRCPQGATCVWAGEASSQVEVTDASGTSFLTLTQPGLAEPPKTNSGNYEITFNLLPYPQVGQEIKDEDYRLHLIISR
jgi:hypothetical protein